MEQSVHFKRSKDSVAPKNNSSNLRIAFGRAKLFEIRRIVRRIKQLSQKKGTDQQLQKNKRKILRLEGQLEVLKDTNISKFIEAVDEEDDEKESNENVNDAQRLVISKILNMIKQTTTKKDARVKSSSTKKRDNLTEKSDVITNITSKDIEMPHSAVAAVDSVLIGSLKMAKNGKTDDKKKKIRKRKDSISSDTEITHTKCAENTGVLSVDSMFVDSLKNDKEGKERKIKKSKDRKKSANRLGQRKRREQWERLYGIKANHLKSKKNNTDRTSKNKSKNKMRPLNEEHLGSKKKPEGSSVLHPSWEASISKRKQESIVAFQGQKITFDD